MAKAKTTTIKATSRMSIKVKNDFFTVEYCEERVVPDDDSVNLEEERKALWEDVTKEVEDQISEITETFG